MVKEKTKKQIQIAIDYVRAEKPNDKSELDRRYAIVLTELEKIQVLINHYLEEPK